MIAQNCNPNQIASKTPPQTWTKKGCREAAEYGVDHGEDTRCYDSCNTQQRPTRLLQGGEKQTWFFELILKYSYGFCLDWQQHLNEQFCEEIDTKDNVIPVVSMATDMLDGIYPSRVLCNHLVSQSSFQTL